MFKAHRVEVGTSNGTLTEILSGIDEGTEVLTDFSITGSENGPQSEQTNNPFMPRRPNRGNSRGGNGGNAGNSGNAGGAPSNAGNRTPNR